VDDNRDRREQCQEYSSAAVLPRHSPPPARDAHYALSAARPVCGNSPRGMFPLKGRAAEA